MCSRWRTVAASPRRSTGSADGSPCRPRQACRFGSALSQRVGGDVARSPPPVDHMLLLARWAGVSPRQSVLEINERESIADQQRLRLVLASYASMASSSLSTTSARVHPRWSCSRLPSPSFVKVAKSITQACDERGARAVIGATVAYARSSGSTVMPRESRTRRRRTVSSHSGHRRTGILARPPARNGRRSRSPR